MTKFNPFRPAQIVTVGMFCGRADELKTIDQSLLQTKYGNPKHFLISGEPGIGKSSLMLCVKYTAKGDIPIHKQKLNFIVLDVALAGSHTYEDIVSRIKEAFLEEVEKHQWIRTSAAQTWEFITRLRAFGVEIKTKEPIDDPTLIDSLCNGIAIFLKAVGNKLDGIVILIDEADQPAEAAKLGEFCKLFTEKLTKLQCDRVCLGLAGLPSLMAKLRASHRSSPRIFETLALGPLEDHESKDVVRRGLEEAERQNHFKTTIADDALQAIVRLSEGYPHFIQQFAFSAFDQDEDNNITFDDVDVGIHKENGALDQLGERFFFELYSKIDSDEDRQIVDAMAEMPDEWLTTAQIIKGSGLKKTQANSAINRLSHRGILLHNERESNEYRLPTKSFAVWIKASNLRQAQQKSKKTKGSS